MLHMSGPARTPGTGDELYRFVPHHNFPFRFNMRNTFCPACHSRCRTTSPPPPTWETTVLFTAVQLCLVWRYKYVRCAMTWGSTRGIDKANSQSLGFSLWGCSWTQSFSFLPPFPFKATGSQEVYASTLLRVFFTALLVSSSHFQGLFEDIENVLLAGPSACWRPRPHEEGACARACVCVSENRVVGETLWSWCRRQRAQRKGRLANREGRKRKIFIF